MVLPQQLEVVVASETVAPVVPVAFGCSCYLLHGVDEADNDVFDAD